MASSPITSWKIDGETTETVRDLIFLDSRITAEGDCSHEIKRHLLLWRKAMTNLDSILKSRDVILPTKVCLFKAVVFPVVTYGCESWTIKKAEFLRIDDFELWCWKRLFFFFFGLATPFIHDTTHVSMPFSQIFPPSPSPTESIRLFYTSVSLLLSHTQGYCYNLSKFHIYALVYCIGVFLSGLLHSV